MHMDLYIFGVPQFIYAYLQMLEEGVFIDCLWRTAHKRSVKIKNPL